ncbi:MAG: hypothetical protein NZZ60_09290 [Bacteroidia bacterium]|nr:hypothetical protein [Bacteroidia bacterium]MDW8417028.1 dihydrodipicolinate reductase C-terminal domain-containing protein [Bacteroidia bacterium]
MRLVIIGTGRMGQTLAQVSLEKGHIILAHVGRITSEVLQSINADAVIDFSHASQVLAILEVCLERRIPLITGTTGWYEHLTEFRQKAESVSTARWLWGGNFSRGIALLKVALRSLASVPWVQLPDWEAALVEVHHHRKKDAPSGTAVELSKVFPLTKAIYSMRIGEVVGEHKLLISGPGEEIEILHRAHDRRIFAEGALWAAEWLFQRTYFVGTFDEALSSGLDK